MNENVMSTFTNEAFRDALETLKYGVLIHDEREVVYANPAALTLLHASCPTQVVGRSFVDFVHPDCRAAGTERRRVIESGGRVQGVPIKLLTVDGHTVHVRGDGAPLVIGESTYTLVSAWPEGMSPRS